MQLCDEEKQQSKINAEKEEQNYKELQQIEKLVTLDSTSSEEGLGSSGMNVGQEFEQMKQSIKQEVKNSPGK